MAVPNHPHNCSKALWEPRVNILKGRNTVTLLYVSDLHFQCRFTLTFLLVSVKGIHVTCQTDAEKQVTTKQTGCRMHAGGADIEFVQGPARSV